MFLVLFSLLTFSTATVVTAGDCSKYPLECILDSRFYTQYQEAGGPVIYLNGYKPEPFDKIKQSKQEFVTNQGYIPSSITSDEDFSATFEESKKDEFTKPESSDIKTNKNRKLTLRDCLLMPKQCLTVLPASVLDIIVWKESGNSTDVKSNDVDSSSSFSSSEEDEEDEEDLHAKLRGDFEKVKK